MRKLFRGMMSLIAMLLLLSSSAVANELPRIPLDPAVRVGKLDNGLTYYIRHNDYPKGQADFFIAQKVGSILEEDNQSGLAHFLEHMCFNGTTNFPGNSLISWLESIGVKFGQNLNAYTSIDETVYYLSQVPVARESVVDSCLLILHDWADDLLLEGEEIDKERGVIHEEWRSRNVGQMRIFEQLLPVIYQGERYGKRLPIGSMEVVDNFPYQALRDYYEKWYRPDLQGIIVVGDIDVDAIEKKIKSTFSGIKMPENPAERVYYPVSDNDGLIYAVGKDKELGKATVQLMFKMDAVPDSQKDRMEYMVANYIDYMLAGMINQRISEMASKPDANFAGGGVGKDEFMISKTKDAFLISASPKGHDILPAFETIYREALRAKKGGFSQSEYDRVRTNYLAAMENAYNRRDKISSNSLANELVQNFLYNEPAPGIENEYAMMSMIANQIPLEAINARVAQIIPDTNTNAVLLVMYPDKPEYAEPTLEQFTALMDRVGAENLEAYVDNVKSEPLIASLPAPGKIVKEETDKLFGATVWTLSNGAKVVVKPTDFRKNEILFKAQAMGGTSVLSDADLDNVRYMANAMSRRGLGNYSSNELSRYLTGKRVGVGLGIDDYSRSLSGSAVPKDLPTLMELIYMNFTGFTITPDDYEAGKSVVKASMRNQESTPEFQFSKQMAEHTYKSPRYHSMDTNVVNRASRERIVEIVHEMTANAGDFTFYFVGDINIDTLRPLVEQYIASLPGKPGKAQEVKFAGFGIIPGAATEKVKQKMDVPQTYVSILLSGQMPYDTKRAKAASIAGQIMSARLLKTVREEEGAVYSIGAQGMLSRFSETPAVMATQFPMKPELLDKVLGIIAGEFEAMSQPGNVTAEELNKVKEYMIKSAKNNLTENGPWLSAMSSYEILPKDGFLNAVAEIESITPADIESFVRDLMKQNNYRVFVMEPAE